MFLKNFDGSRIAKTIFEEIKLPTCDTQNLKILQTRIRERLSGMKFFIVLDDV